MMRGLFPLLATVLPELILPCFYITFCKGPVLKSFMRQVAIIKDYDVPRKFWIFFNVSEISIS